MIRLEYKGRPVQINNWDIYQETWKGWFRNRSSDDFNLLNVVKCIQESNDTKCLLQYLDDVDKTHPRSMDLYVDLKSDPDFVIVSFNKPSTRISFRA